eukprot:4857051-Pleurochrysis_carterae.AAC.1
MAHRPVPVSAAHKPKKAIAASAATRKHDPTGGAGGGTPGGRLLYLIPNGQWCSTGNCHFTHDKVNQGGPCYRVPRWPGPLPEKALHGGQSRQQSRRWKMTMEQLTSTATADSSCQSIQRRLLPTTTRPMTKANVQTRRSMAHFQPRRKQPELMTAARR